MKLHLGCGKRHITGWVHIDAVKYDHVDIVHNVGALPMIESGVADVVYACHVLEHFPQDQVWSVLREWARVLKVGGVLRVAVPDFAVLAKLYVQGIPIHQIRGPVIGRHHELYNGHKALFDFSNLAAAMTAAGFSDIHRYNWRTTEHADIDDYSQAYIPHMDKEYGTLISLNVEGVKCLRT